MEINRKIKVGEWITTDEGIGIAERIHDFYFEEFDTIPQDKKIGDYYFSALEYKVFCDYNGKPRKRNRFKESNILYCDPIEKKYKKVLDRSIKQYPKEYASFVKFLEVPKRSNGWKILRFEISEENRLKTVQDMEMIQKMLPPKFTYQNILTIAADNKCIVDLSKPSHPFLVPLILRITLFYAYGDFDGKRILFYEFNYDIEEYDCNLDALRDWINS